MSFRERIAWITLVSIAVCYGVYLTAILQHRATFHLFVICVAAAAAIQVALTVVATVRNPAEAKAPRDERERLIDSRARTLGYYVLVVGMLSLAIPGHTGGSVRDMLHVSFAGVVAAELTVCIAQIVMHRRGV
jgi:hypothetical protein